MVKNLVSRSQFARLCHVSAAAVTKACSGTLVAACDGKRIDVDHPDAVTYQRHHDPARPNEPATGIDPLYEQAVEYCKGAKKPSPNGIRTALSIGTDRATKIFETLLASGVLQPAPTDTPAAPPATKPPTTRVVSGHTAKNNSKKAEALASLPDPGVGGTLHQVPEDIGKFADMTLRELIQRFGTDTAFCDWLSATKSIEDINGRRLKNAEAEGKLVSRALVKVGIIEPIDSAHIKLLTDGSKTIARRACAMTTAGRSVEDVEKFVADQITSFIRPVKAKVSRALRNA